MDAHCHIYLLGGLRVQQGRRTITRFSTHPTAVLLAYLGFHLGRAHPRDILIDLLWPRSILEADRNSLRVAVSSLRHQLEPPGVPPGAVLIVDHFAARLNPDVVATDVVEFEKALRKAGETSAGERRIAWLERAVELYRGELLPGFYEDWVLMEQRRLSAMLCGAIRRLTVHFEKPGNLERAIVYAGRAVSLDPSCEVCQRDLIRLYARAGHPVSAQDQYRQVSRLLKNHEGELPPSPTRPVVRDLPRAFASHSLPGLAEPGSCSPGATHILSPALGPPLPQR